MKAVIILVVSLAAIALLLAWQLKRANREAWRVAKASFLNGLVTDWQVAGYPKGEALDELLNSHSLRSQGRNKPFVLTNSVSIGGTNYQFVFGIKPFPDRSETLAITRSRAVVQIDGSRARVRFVPERQ